MVAHHAAYFCLYAQAQLASAGDHAVQSLLLAQQLHAPRFEAEALAFRGEMHRLAGRMADARSDIQQALAIGRKSGMAYTGAIILGIAARITADPKEREEALSEAEALLAAGAVSHNHLLFRMDAIEACLEMGDWQRADRYATELEQYTRAEPLPLYEFFIARGRALAAAGRDPQCRDLLAELRRLVREGDRFGHAIAVAALRSAIDQLHAQ
jgi:hypothetical protein